MMSIKLASLALALGSTFAFLRRAESESEPSVHSAEDFQCAGDNGTWNSNLTLLVACPFHRGESQVGQSRRGTAILLA